KRDWSSDVCSSDLKPLVDPGLISNQNFDLEEDGEGKEALETVKVAEEGIKYKANPAMKEVTFDNKGEFLEYLYNTMETAAKNMEFEEAARIRDQIEQLEDEL